MECKKKQKKSKKERKEKFVKAKIKTKIDFFHF
jgi:hypothetical protein